MLTCSNCGATVRESAKFCTSCGTRLNDAATSDSDSAWASPPPATDSESSATENPEANDVTGSGTTTSPWAAATPGAAEPVAEPEAGETKPADTFSWTWGKGSEEAEATTVQADDSSEAAANVEDNQAVQVDEESGIVIEETETSVVDDAVVDATELEILDGDHPESDATHEPGIVAATNEEPSDGDKSQIDIDANADTEALASWAGRWDTPDDESDVSNTSTDEADAISSPDTLETDEATPEVTAMDHATPNDDLASSDDENEDNGSQFNAGETGDGSETDVMAGAGQSDEAGKDDRDEEDTVARAERLIGELKAIIPSLARPLPASRQPLPVPSTVADDLERAARVGNFDDIRDALFAARDNPRDVDNMLGLSSRVDRLLELLDDRNNLAKTAESAAGTLRSNTDSSEI